MEKEHEQKAGLDVNMTFAFINFFFFFFLIIFINFSWVTFVAEARGM